LINRACIIYIIFTILLICAAFLNPIDACAKESTENIFLTAVHEIDAGDFDQAIKILKSLDFSNPTPRIKLELARALFNKGELIEARKLFISVYTKDFPPVPVREKIENYINQIDRQLGKFDFSFGIISEKNPVHQPNDFLF